MKAESPDFSMKIISIARRARGRNFVAKFKTTFFQKSRLSIFSQRFGGCKVFEVFRKNSSKTLKVMTNYWKKWQSQIATLKKTLTTFPILLMFTSFQRLFHQLFWMFVCVSKRHREVKIPLHDDLRKVMDKKHPSEIFWSSQQFWKSWNLTFPLWAWP